MNVYNYIQKNVHKEHFFYAVAAGNYVFSVGMIANGHAYGAALAMAFASLFYSLANSIKLKRAIKEVRASNNA